MNGIIYGKFLDVNDDLFKGQTIRINYSELVIIN